MTITSVNESKNSTIMMTNTNDWSEEIKEKLEEHFEGRELLPEWSSRGDDDVISKGPSISLSMTNDMTNDDYIHDIYVIIYVCIMKVRE